MHNYFDSEHEMKSFSLNLNNFQMHNFDGIVLEIWSQIPTQKLLDMSPDFIRELAQRIRSAGYTFILVIPPAVYQGLFSMPFALATLTLCIITFMSFCNSCFHFL